MRLFVAIGVVLAAGALGYLLLDPFGDGSDSVAGAGGTRSGSVEGSGGTGSGSVADSGEVRTEPLSGTACQRLAGLAANLAARDRTAEAFLTDLGQQGAGIRPGRFALIDLARDGRNMIQGRGFKPEFDDGTRGQVRHFAGAARASMFGGTALTRWISEQLRDDPADSPDGRLADEGIAFAQALLAGRLEPNAASGWIRERLCKP
ncbi:MAG TPA: hypothetical protein VKA41_06310 [Solirubrobacterales bacterium]|nr:hypothetical protein [Solirubrobacterales bacterium]